MAEAENFKSEVEIRPVFLTDKTILSEYRVFLRRMLAGLAGEAHIAAIAGPAGDDMESVLCPSAEHIRHPAIGLCFLRRTNRMMLLEKLAKFRPTILHGFWPGCGDLLCFLSARLEIPYVQTFLAPVGRFSRIAVEPAYAGALLGPCDTICQSLLRRRPKLSERIEKVHIGGFVEDDCACFSNPGRKVGLLVVDRLDNAALFEPLLRAVRHLLLDGFEVELMILGQGGGERGIRRMVRSLRLTQSVTIVPPMRSLRAIFSGADVFIHLRDVGRFNMALLEAVSVGLALAGCADQTTGLMQEDGSATIFDPADELNIYNSLRGLLSRSEEGRKTAVEVQARLSRDCSVSGMLEQLMQIYRRVQQWHSESRQDAAAAVKQ